MCISVLMTKMCTLTHSLCDIIEVNGFVYDLCSSHPPGGNPEVLASLLKSCNVFFLYIPVMAACQMFPISVSCLPVLKTFH